MVVTVGLRPDGKPRQIVRSAANEASARALLAELIAEHGLTGERTRGHGREGGARLFDVSPLLTGGPLGLLPRRSLQSVATALGVSITVTQAHCRSGLTAFEADRWAVACKVHPFEVWGWSWIEQALLGASGERAGDFVPEPLDQLAALGH